MSRHLTDNQDEILRRLKAGEEISGPRPPIRNGYVRPYVWPNGSSVNAMSLRAMAYGGLIKIIKIDETNRVTLS